MIGSSYQLDFSVQKLQRVAQNDEEEKDDDDGYDNEEEDDDNRL